MVSMALRKESLGTDLDTSPDNESWVHEQDEERNHDICEAKLCHDPRNDIVGFLVGTRARLVGCQKEWANGAAEVFLSSVPVSHIQVLGISHLPIVCMNAALTKAR